MADFRYPTRQLSASDDYLHLKVVKYTPPGIPTLGSSTQNTNANVTPIHNIYLPIPEGISDSNSVDWGDDSLNPIAATAVNEAKGIVGSADFGKSIASSIANIIGIANDQVIGGNAQDAIQTGFAAAAVNSLGANVSVESLLSRASGQVLNPNMELLFKGVKLRSFNFAYNIVARDSNEASVIKAMIRTLKLSMAPRKGSAQASGGSSLFISAPDIFQLEYKKGASKHPFLPTFKPAALISLNVNYSGSGSYATYSDGTPVHLTLNMSFQELNPVYYEDYEETDAKIGVGY